MNKLIIGLLVVAAGAGIFLLLRKKKETTTANNITKEWILGKWKTQLYQPAKDSAQPMFLYNFQKEGILLRSLSDSAKADTTLYEWNKANEIVWKEKASDSTGKVYVVTILTRDSLQVRSADSSTVLFTKLK